MLVKGKETELSMQSNQVTASKTKMKSASDACHGLNLLLAAAALLLCCGNLYGSNSRETYYYYVKPGANYSCAYDHCGTLTWYTEHNEVFQNLSGNVTVVFLPGIHQLSKSLEMTGLDTLFLSGKASNVSAHIQCTVQAYCKFTNMNVLRINNLAFSYCGGFTNMAIMVILAEDVQKLFISNSHFSQNNRVISANRTKEVVITNCFFDENGALYSPGGAISVSITTTLEIRKSNFTNNHCSLSGGAIFVTDSLYVTISSSRFVNNSAHTSDCMDCSSGGAISIFGLTTDTYLTTVILDGDNLFENNYALVSGGGLYVQQLLILTICKESVFRHNTAQFRGGGLAVQDGLNVTVLESSFVNNQGSNIGGAVSISNVLFISLMNCTFTGNRVTSQGVSVLASGGGGIAIIGLRSSPYTTTVVIKGFLLLKKNHADGSGGALFAQSVIFNLKAKSCIFEENTAVTRGGALAILVASKVSIERSIFSVNRCQRDAGAVSLLLVEDVVFTDAQFVSNYAGNEAGAVFINGIEESKLPHQTKVTFEGHTLFQSNFALGNGGGLRALDLVLEFHGRAVFQSNYVGVQGGGMVLSNTTAMFWNDLHMENNRGNYSGGGIYSVKSTAYFHGNITNLTNCVSGFHGGGLYGHNSSFYFRGKTVFFENNKAFRLGGGFGGFGIVLRANIDMIHFINNTSQIGGALLASQALGQIHPNQVEIWCSDTVLFDNNRASYSGGAVFFQHTQVSLQGEIIGVDNQAKENGGWLYAFEGTLTILGKLRLVGNSGESGGTMFGEKTTFVLKAWPMVFARNIATKVGGAIHLDLTNLHLFSYSAFVGNSAQEGGAIRVDQNSQLHLYYDTIATFKLNYAWRGAAISVNDYTNAKTCYFKSRCFFENNVLLNEEDPRNLENFPKQLFFYNNSASEGSDLFGGLLDRCELYGLRTIGTHYSGIDAWYILANTTQHHVSSDPMRVCFCLNNSHNCTHQTHMLSRIRGQLINISAVVVDQVENYLPSTVIRAQFPQDSKGQLGEGEYIQRLPAQCSQLNYHVYSPSDDEYLVIYSDNGPCRDLEKSKIVVAVNFLPCPLGFQLSQQNTTCVCHSPLQRFTNTCDIDSQTIQRKGSFWFSYENSSLALHPHCPFDYCKANDKAIQVRIIDINEQCAHNRQGTLCGACKTNLSLSLGSSQCSSCQSSRYVWLTILFALAGILLVVFLLLFRFTVAMGTINGLVFYANVVAVNKAILFPSVKTSPLLVFIAWLNLDVGIETCYYNGMDTYGRTWLQFVFPMYVWTLVALIILVSHYSTYAARIFGRNPVSVLATLFLLSYTKLLQTIITVFTFSYIEYPETNETRAVWLYDANIDYLDGKHIPLFIAALLFLFVFFLPYTFLLLFGQCLRRLSRKRGLGWTKSMVFTSVMDAYQAPYKVRHRYWTGLMLLVRCVLFMTFSFNVLGDPSVNLLAINTVIVLVVVPATYLKVYSKRALTLLELSFLINLAVLAGVTHQIQFSQDNKEIVSKASVMVVLLTFVGILIYHSYVQLKDTAAWRKIRQIQTNSKFVATDEELNDMTSTEVLGHPKNAPTMSVVERPYLEPLLVDADIQSDHQTR